MDKLRALRARFQNRDSRIDPSEGILIALEIADCVSAITAAMADGKIDPAEAAEIGREVADLRAVLAEAMAD